MLQDLEAVKAELRHEKRVNREAVTQLENSARDLKKSHFKEMREVESKHQEAVQSQKYATSVILE